ncbi:MAG: hypothetical protein HQL46_14075, partial [Gammaproteobacteria bacterium]|nr:hypothetical protein [Gammaproteobacteria bacterium]
YKLADFIAPLPKKEEWVAQFPSTLDWTGQGANSKYNKIKNEYSEQGKPLSYQKSLEHITSTTHKAYTPEDILRLLKTVKAGESIEIQPGIYYLDIKRIPINTIATKELPIHVYAKKLGDVYLKLNTVEGFNINAPFWSFQNLIIQGNCTSHTQCEHAFHIVGKADSTIIRNNIISDFNAAIKGNGLPVNNQQIDMPNKVLIEHNSFTFSAPRKTSNPVTPIDVVGGDSWLIKGNLISDFIKAAGDNISYGAFLKGESTNGVMEENLVICSKNLDGRLARQVGLSLGGGGTGNSSCANNSCDFEHKNGIIRNNIIMNCNDVGVYINKAPKTTITNNTLFNTIGIDVRFPESSAQINNNILNGRIKSRDNAQITEENNQENLSLSELEEDWFQSPKSANFINKEQNIPAVTTTVTTDFCGNNRTKNKSNIGAIDYTQVNNNNCKRLLANRLNPIETDISQLKTLNIATKPKIRKTNGKKLLESVRVCSKGCQFSDLNQALQSVKSYGKVYIAAEKRKLCGVINWPVTIIGESSDKMSKPHLYGSVCKGKGTIIIESNDVTINNLQISDLNANDGNAACIRLGPDAKNTTIKNIYCHDSQNGILGHFKQGSLYVTDSTFERNGYGGLAHGMYLGTAKGSIHINKTRILSGKGSGHTLKITAPTMLIENSVLAALNGKNSRAIDNYGSGNLILRNNVIQQGPNSENNDMIGLALEPKRVLPGEFKTLLEKNWFIFDNKKQKGWLSDSNTGRLFNNQSNNTITLNNNWIIGMNSLNTHISKQSDNQIFESRSEIGLPNYDGTLKTLPVDVNKE